MNAKVISLLMLTSGPLLAVGLLYLMRPKHSKIQAGLIAGLLTTRGAWLNFLIEALGARYDVYWLA